MTTAIFIVRGGAGAMGFGNFHETSAKKPGPSRSPDGAQRNPGHPVKTMPPVMADAELVPSG